MANLETKIESITDTMLDQPTPWHIPWLRFLPLMTGVAIIITHIDQFHVTVETFTVKQADSVGGGRSQKKKIYTPHSMITLN